MTTPLLLRAIAGEPVPHPPVWFMRQAGRSLPEYRKLREGVAMLDSCMRADLIIEITLQPVRRHGVDAAIFFSDIVLPLKAIGVDLDIVPGVGPVIAEPVRSAAGLDQLRALEPVDVEFVTEAVQGLVGELGETPLIGFAGAPFTLASYLIEGGPSKDHARTKALMNADPDLWHSLLTRLGAISAAFLRVQVEAGARAVQLFDSWVGGLNAADYVAYVQPHVARIFREVHGAPTIHFGTGTATLLEPMAIAGGDLIGVDHRQALDEAWARIGFDRGIQGNLDGTRLLGGWEATVDGATDVLRRAANRPGHVFNLGHGVLPDTDPDVLRRLVDLVHEESAR